MAGLKQTATSARLNEKDNRNTRLDSPKIDPRHLRGDLAEEVKRAAMGSYTMDALRERANSVLTDREYSEAKAESGYPPPLSPNEHAILNSDDAYRIFEEYKWRLLNRRGNDAFVNAAEELFIRAIQKVSMLQSAALSE